MKKYEPVKLISVANDMEAKMIIGLLENNDIPCLKKDNFTGNYMGIFMGYSIFGEELYVNVKDYDKAKEILESLGDEEDIESMEGMISDSVEHVRNQDIVFYKKPSIVAKIIIAIIVVIFLITYTMQFYN